MRKDFSEDIGHFSVLEMKKNGMERTLPKQEGKWNDEANQKIEHFKQTGHPVFQGTTRNLEEKRKKKYDSPYCGISKH